MFSRSKQDQRKKEFKKGIDADESRRKREEQAIEIRKSKRDVELDKKRRNVSGATNFVLESHDISSKAEPQVSLQDLQANLMRVMGDDQSQWLPGTIYFRKLLSIEKNPPINEVIRSGVVPRFVQFLQAFHIAKLQYEAAWALTNIASGTAEQTAEILKYGAVEQFVALLSSPDEELREQAVWALGNIAGDSASCRDYCLARGALHPLLNILNSNAKSSLMRNATWALSNLCRGKPHVSFVMVQDALPVLARLIHSVDNEVIIDACWALSYISDGNEHSIQAVLNTGIARRLIELMGSSSQTVQTPALRTIGNIVTGTDEQTQAILDLGALPVFNLLLQSSKKSLRKESAWAISNITAGNKEQTQAVIDAGIMPQIAYLLANGEFDVKKECAWAICNATSYKVPQQIHALVKIGVVKPLCDLLKTSDAKIINVALDALENILIVGETHAKNGENLYTQAVEEADGIDRLEDLQEHDNEEIYEKSVKLIEDYFGGEEEDENLAPNTSGAQFSFGNNVQVPNGGFAF